MGKNKMRRHFIILSLIFTVGFGCKFLDLEKYREASEEVKTTVITKKILEERLEAKGIKTAPVMPDDKPNPLTLHLRFSNRNNEYLLNYENYENFGALANKLREIFRMRESNGVFIEGTNEIYKKITLPAYESYVDEYNSKNIFVEDFEKLVDDLKNEGFNQIELDINEQNLPYGKDSQNLLETEPIKSPQKERSVDSTSVKSDAPKTISGGVLNGKAIDLPKPAYSAAARAVRASGAVNVQVTVDEKGDVVSASAVSGHPLLRASAAAAAREAKFNPTVLSGKAVKVTGILVYNFNPE